LGFKTNDEILKLLVGKTVEKITLDEVESVLSFRFTDNSTLEMFHHQDCCESVFLINEGDEYIVFVRRFF